VDLFLHKREFENKDQELKLPRLSTVVYGNAKGLGSFRPVYINHIPILTHREGINNYSKYHYVL
jgi:hypothetical protein